MKNDYRIKGGIVEIYLNRGMKTIISREDLDLVKQYDGKWHAGNSGKNEDNPKWYAQINVRTHRDSNGRWKYRKEKLSRVILDLRKGNPLVADHKDGNTLNDTRDNLRAVTAGQNGQNKKARNKSKTGVRGVKLNSRGRYEAYVQTQGMYFHIGIYDTIEEAETEVKKARKDIIPDSLE